MSPVLNVLSLPADAVKATEDTVGAILSVTPVIALLETVNAPAVTPVNFTSTSLASTPGVASEMKRYESAPSCQIAVAPAVFTSPASAKIM